MCCETPLYHYYTLTLYYTVHISSTVTVQYIYTGVGRGLHVRGCSMQTPDQILQKFGGFTGLVYTYMYRQYYTE